MDRRDIERTKLMVRGVAALFYVGFVIIVSALDSYVIRSGLSMYAKIGVAILIAFFLFPLIDIIVEHRARRK
jgi:hypothetical protein